MADCPIVMSNPNTKAVTIHLREGDGWGIFLDRRRLPRQTEEYSALLHESGHYATGATHAVSSPFDLVEKHEYSANKWAARQAVTEEALDEAVAAGITDISGLAEHFNITEDLMRMAVCWYTYGNVAAEMYF